MKHYPSTRYHPEHGSKVVASEQEDHALEGWFHSPADFGVETCPGKHPDPAIAEKRAAFEKGKGKKSDVPIADAIISPAIEAMQKKLAELGDEADRKSAKPAMPLGLTRKGK